ncbi:putative methanogenesis marker protein 3 [Methanolinea mesophila]|uniref:methyl-coenzyme M reductase-associated protein Mmp3 n=1 Tax=Methanolinea mesophila TaxID=547055 RepID=UPI001AE4011B|nr:methanogenesis marker 3 protein [Methanolinea mesophila]MBP1928766.1 putative methanogenesis marker protein 3 [Methanolinea mesophila]
MITVQVDGEFRKVPKGSTLADIIPSPDPDCVVAVIRPGAQESATTRSFRILTTAGEVVVEALPSGNEVFSLPALGEGAGLHWTDRYAAAFGPFPQQFAPARKPFLYERGDVILGCGGYDPTRSYLIFAKMRHSSDLGAPEGGGVLGKVTSGRGVIDRWATGDRITGIAPVISWADTTQSFTTREMATPLEEGMQVVTFAAINADGYRDDEIDTGSASSVEKMLLALKDGHFIVERAASTYIEDQRSAGTDVPEENPVGRMEGSVTLRTRGKSRGSVYIYTTDIPSVPSHTVAGQVVHGIELAKLARQGDTLCVRVMPDRFDLIGVPLDEAIRIAETRGIALEYEPANHPRVVVDQDPGTTLECLAARAAALTAIPEEHVIDIRLDDANAPESCEIFRRITGLDLHGVGRIPFLFNFEEVYLFKPSLPHGTRINPENAPKEVVPAGSLAITNDSRKGAGLVGVRLAENREFGPTSEPFEGTNLIGWVIDTEKLKGLKENETVYIREVVNG